MSAKRFVSAAKEMLSPQNTNIVTNKSHAIRILNKILSLPPDRHVFAIDTETLGVDPSFQSPHKNAKLICASIYCGPNADFGNGPRVWIENTREKLIEVFRPFLEDEKYKKIFHNYSFDYHVIANCSIKTRGLAGDTLHMARLADTDKMRYSLQRLSAEYLDREKAPFSEIMKGVKTENTKYAKGLANCPLWLQSCEETRLRWIDYCVYDAEATWMLYEKLREKLEAKRWLGDKSLFEFYEKFYVPFAHTLVQIEERGIKIDMETLQKSFEKAVLDCRRPLKEFMAWAQQFEPNAKYLNVRSPRQIQQLLFGPKTAADEHRSNLPLTHEFKFENTRKHILPGEKKAKKYIKFPLRGLGFKPLSKTASGKPQCTLEVFRKLAGSPFGDNPTYGAALDNFADKRKGREACRALFGLYKMNQVDSLLSNFIEPLSEHCDENYRIHCSLNLNTNTGRISARSPNLQNQPAYDKDIYRIRSAFVCEEGNRLIVADYGQLELRVLAHISRCPSMIRAFLSGGDFHSRTAMAIYPYIKEAVERGEVAVTKGGNGEAPSIKERFVRERQKAKEFNFSILYGKSKYTLAKDFGISQAEAGEILRVWYADRPEVKRWQEFNIRKARETGETRTLLGRYRRVRGIRSESSSVRAHAERIAMNTPIQGGAADIVMTAMIKMGQNERLRGLGWAMVMQIHDEVILEGPEEHVGEAFGIVEECLTKPFEEPLRVPLDVNMGIGRSWAEVK